MGMTEHDRLYQESAARVLDKQHGELVVLTPTDAAPRPVTVRVGRGAREVALAGGNAERHSLVVTVKRSDLPVIREGSDALSLAVKRGEQPSTVYLEELLNDAGDEWVVACR